MTATHVPRPREHGLPSGDLAVSSHWVHGVRDVTTVPAADRDLYRLLMDILGDVWVPDLMPARLATACDDLVAVRDAVDNIDRGRADIGGVGWGMGYCKRVRDAIADYRDRDPLRLAAVGCSGSKFEDDDPMPAKDRYKGAYWVNKRRYYETCADDGRIISAEHAVLHPGTPIDYYEKTPDDLRGIPIDSDQRLPNGDAVTTLLDRWALDVHEQLAAWLHEAAGGIDPRDVDLEILLGTDYRDPLAARGVFDALRIPGALAVSFPFQEVEQAQGGLFEQIGWMSDAVEVVTDGGER
ncbi:DUF6884 domain-containing protein [Halostella litorea]|uniref:DUF6884 domain-containing protein n=1 Tax=Halostella litorea TaxID=2528831 RepID=UPI001091DAC6|nr:DUF6884 domain-containing protein [Halostella litorea]